MLLKSYSDITRQYRHIFLSPHFEDVVYSCGGTLGVQVSSGLRPLTITVFGGAPPAGTELSPFALQVHRNMGFTASQRASEAVDDSLTEDASALDFLTRDY